MFEYSPTNRTSLSLFQRSLFSVASAFTGSTTSHTQIHSSLNVAVRGHQCCKIRRSHRSEDKSQHATSRAGLPLRPTKIRLRDLGPCFGPKYHENTRAASTRPIRVSGALLQCFVLRASSQCLGRICRDACPATLGQLPVQIRDVGFWQMHVHWLRCTSQRRSIVSSVRQCRH